MALAAIAVSCSSGSSRRVDSIQVVTQLPSVRQVPFDTPLQKTIFFGSFTGTNGLDSHSFRLAAAASFPKTIRIPSPSNSPSEGHYIIIISGRLNKAKNTIRDRSRAIEAVRRYLGPSEASTMPAVMQLVRLRAEFEALFESDSTRILESVMVEREVPLNAAEPTYIDDMMEEAVRDGIPALAEKIQTKLALS
jgi:hypothetical protein